MRDVDLVGRRGLLLGVALGCLGTVVGCGTGSESSAPTDPAKVEEYRKVTADYMRTRRKNRMRGRPCKAGSQRTRRAGRPGPGAELSPSLPRPA
jgi:hypothetical protein